MEIRSPEHQQHDTEVTCRGNHAYVQLAIIILVLLRCFIPGTSPNLHPIRFSGAWGVYRNVREYEILVFAGNGWLAGAFLSCCPLLVDLFFSVVQSGGFRVCAENRFSTSLFSCSSSLTSTMPPVAQRGNLHRAGRDLRNACLSDRTAPCRFHRVDNRGPTLRQLAGSSRSINSTHNCSCHNK